MGQCCHNQANHTGITHSSKYEELEDAEMYELLEYRFILKIFVDIKSLRLPDKVEKIAFSVHYGDRFVKEWTEEVKGGRNTEHSSKTIRITLDQHHITQPIYVDISTLNHNKIKIESIPEEFSFMKSAISGGCIIQGKMLESPIKIQVFEDLHSLEEADTHNSFRFEIEYNPSIIPCDDIEKVKVVFSEVTDKGVFEIYEGMVDDNLNDLTESNTANHSGSFEDNAKRFSICFSTSQFLARKNTLSKRKFQLELYNIDNGKLIARSKSFMLSQILKALGKRHSLSNISGVSIQFNNFIISLSDNKRGSDYSKTLSMDIVNLYRVNSVSLFSYFASKDAKVLPLFGLDFSHANLTFDDNICLHRTKEDKPKVYLKLLSKISEAIRFFSTNYCIPYAFGCKAKPGSPTSDCLALSGDYFEPQVNLDAIENRYRTTVNKIEFSLPPNHSEIFSKANKLVKLSKEEKLDVFLLHFHITPGLIEDYKELCKSITSDIRNGDPKSVYVIRLKMKNLQEEDVDLLNLMNDINTHERLCKPLMHVFDLDCYADDRTIDAFIDRLMFCIIQDIQTYINRNLFDLLRRNIEEENKMSIQGKSSFHNIDGEELARASYAIKDISSVVNNQEKMNRSDNEFIEKLITNMKEERSQLERNLEMSNPEYDRNKFKTILCPEINQVTAQIILEGDNYTERNASVVSTDFDKLTM